MNRLDEINNLADESEGFVWRLQSDSGNATDIEAGRGPYFLVNMSVWESVEALFQFVYKTAHRDLMINRRRWFRRPTGAYQVLWWVPVAHTPTVEEGLERLDTLQAKGPTARAFNFQNTYPPPGEVRHPESFKFDPNCSGWG